MPNTTSAITGNQPRYPPQPCDHTSKASSQNIRVASLFSTISITTPAFKRRQCVVQQRSCQEADTAVKTPACRQKAREPGDEHQSNSASVAVTSLSGRFWPVESAAAHTPPVAG